MKGTFFTITIIILLLTNHSPHKDKIARPTQYTFVFENQDTIRIPHTNESALDSICKKLLQDKTNLISAEMILRTGEQLSFRYANSALQELKITDKKDTSKVPKGTLEKLQKIHFQSVALLWDGRYQKAFESSYFIIQFDTGMQKEFGGYPYVQLGFTQLQLYSAGIWKSISEDTIQWQDF